MWIKSLKLNNVRSFAMAEIAFSRGINLLIGPNNSGKSTILLPLLGLQEGLPHLTGQDVRRGQNTAKAEIVYGDENQLPFNENRKTVWYEFRPGHNDFPLFWTTNQTPRKAPNKEPHNFIYPFVSNSLLKYPLKHLNITRAGLSNDHVHCEKESCPI